MDTIARTHDYDVEIVSCEELSCLEGLLRRVKAGEEEVLFLKKTSCPKEHVLS